MLVKVEVGNQPLAQSRRLFEGQGGRSQMSGVSPLRALPALFILPHNRSAARAITAAFACKAGYGFWIGRSRPEQPSLPLPCLP